MSLVQPGPYVAVSIVSLVTLWEAGSWVIDSRKIGWRRLIYFLIYFFISPLILYSANPVWSCLRCRMDTESRYWTRILLVVRSGIAQEVGEQRFELDVSQVGLCLKSDERVH